MTALFHKGTVLVSFTIIILLPARILYQITIVTCIATVSSYYYPLVPRKNNDLAYTDLLWKRVWERAATLPGAKTHNQPGGVEYLYLKPKVFRTKSAL